MADIQAKAIGFKLAIRRLRQAKNQRIAKRLHELLSELWSDAGEALIRAAISQVLVETGMSAASFFPLSRAIKRVGASQEIISHISSNRTLESSPGIPEFPSGKRVSGERGIRAGVSRGTKAFEFSFGTPSKPIFQFEFATLVFQLAFHERTQKVLGIGKSAFWDYVMREASKVTRTVLAEFLRRRGK